MRATQASMPTLILTMIAGLASASANRPNHSRPNEHLADRSANQKSLQAEPISATHSVADPTEGLFIDSFEEGLALDARNIRIDLPGGAYLPGRLYVPAQSAGAAVVMVHGCSGLWSDGLPWTIAQGAIERWGWKLAESGYLAIAIDSYTSRTPELVDPLDFQTQCTGDTYAGAVDPYTTRVADMDTAIAWLRYHFGPKATNHLGALGWSQGGQSVLVRSAETYRDANVPRFVDAADEATAQIASVVFYPGCGTFLGFIDEFAIEDSYWRPHRDLVINHGGDDPLHVSCSKRAEIAVAGYDATSDSGHWARYIEYPNARHSFDNAIDEWPDAPCSANATPDDACAARKADITSFEFLSTRLGTVAAHSE